jgi:hypothetical protein
MGLHRVEEFNYELGHHSWMHFVWLLSLAYACEPVFDV